MAYGLLIECSGEVTEAPRESVFGNDATADFVRDDDTRDAGSGDLFEFVAELQFPAGHYQVAQPKSEAIDDNDVEIRRDPAYGARDVEGLLDGGVG